MPIPSEKIKEDVELNRKWRPKRNVLSFLSDTSDRKQGGDDYFLNLLKGIFASLAWLWLYLLLTGVVLALAGIIYFLCEYLPKH